MKPEKVIAAFARLVEIIEGCGYSRKFAARLPPERMDELMVIEDDDRIVLMNHLFFMCEEGKNLTVEAIEEYLRQNNDYARSRLEKAMRWLGFVQGMLVAAGVCSIQQMKVINGPDGSD
jgi:hypothetical protein